MYDTYRHILALTPVGDAVGPWQKVSQCRNTGCECHKVPTIATGSLYMFLLPVATEFNRRDLARSELQRLVRPHTRGMIVYPDMADWTSHQEGYRDHYGFDGLVE